MSRSPQEREMLAIAFLTGEAGPVDIAEYEALLAADPEFRDLVHALEATLSPLNAEIAPREPPAGLFDTIMDEIDTSSPAEPVPIAPVSEPTPAPARSSEPWRTIAVISSIAAAVSIGAHIWPTAAPGPGTLPVAAAPDRDYIALLADDSAPSVVVVVYDADSGQLLARYSNVSLPTDDVWQLWRIRDGVPAPTSLGLLESSGREGAAELSIAPELLDSEDTLAVSLEPQGGSPEAGPTGPILFTGKVGEI
ncbi:MAG: anti-sigma factor [Pseudomonadota bacterium]